MNRLPAALLILCFAFCVASFTRAGAAEPTNMILFIADDVSWNDYGCYGNKFARTPNIDQLADNGVRFDNAFLTASSCSPSRASIVTGRYPHNNGKAAELHLPIAGHLDWFPELMRKSGYHTVLSGKNHMSSTSGRVKAFDAVDGGRIKGNSGGHANWSKFVRERPRSKPFFFWFAAYDAHRGWDADKQWNEKEYGPAHTPENVFVPPFLVDNKSTRQDLASYYNEVTRFDHHIGLVVNELKKQNAFDDTLILVMADNGRPFPRAKTRLHDSGMKTALVAHWPAGIKNNGPSSSLVSVIDIAPTAMQIAGLEPAPTMQGVSLLPLLSGDAKSVRRYAFSEHNWHDYEAHGRSVRDGKFLYIKNNRPNQSWQGPADSVRSPSHKDLLNSKSKDTLTAAQTDVFLNPRPAEEFYAWDDSNQMKNLIGDPKYAAEANRLRDLLKQWTVDTGDSVPEKISADSFHRETGDRIHKNESAYRFTTPGEDTGADRINAPGPR